MSARKRRAARREAGVSLLELTIALTIALFALSAATGLLIESQRRASRVAQESRQPPIDLVLRQLRADLRASRGVVGVDSVWSHAPLVLLGHPAGELVWRLDGAELRRVTTEGLPGRLLLPGVSTFRYRAWWGSRATIEVEIGRFERRRLQAVTGPAGVAADTGEHLQLWGVLATPRSAGAISW